MEGEKGNLACARPATPGGADRGSVGAGASDHGKQSEGLPLATGFAAASAGSSPMMLRWLGVQLTWTFGRERSRVDVALRISLGRRAWCE